MPTPINPALLINGPAYVFYKGKAIYTEDSIQLTPKRDVFSVEMNQVGPIEEREASLSYELKFKPSGDITQMAVLWPYGIILPGELLHPAADIVSAVAGTDVVTFSNLARYRAGSPVVVAAIAAGALPAPLASGTYYLGSISGNTAKMFATEAAAIAGTGQIDITATGVGRIIEQEYLKIVTFTGKQYLFANAVVSDSPDFNGTGGDSAIGDVTFECFRAFATAPTGANSFYTMTTGVSLDTSFAPGNIVTEPYALSWGGAAPWAAISTKDGIKFNFSLTTDPVMDDTVGIISRRVREASVVASCKPLGISEDDVYAKLLVQGAGAGRGHRIIDANPLIANGPTTPIFLQLYGAVLQPPTISYDDANDRVMEISWKPTRTFAAGVAKGLYWVGGSAAP